MVGEISDDLGPVLKLLYKRLSTRVRYVKDSINRIR